MQRIILFCFSLFLIVSCQKEEIETSIENTTESVSLRNSSPTDCGYIDELCEPCKLEFQEQLPDYTICCGLVVNDDGGNSFEVRSIPMFSGSDEYVVTTSSGDTYILTNTTNEYIISHSENYQIPRGLKNIFRLNQTKLESGNYTDAEIAQKEREIISIRTKQALAEKKKQGVKLGTPQNFTQEGRNEGVETLKMKAKTNMNNKRAIPMIREYRKSGLSLQKIANKLNENGFQTSRGKKFQKTTTVKRLISEN